ncbi:hypothetical protein F5Y14DRAFT_284876 [Nemania sp. NC0429]|nr:hypothetical protein F5Y14DRAFT_284876 [Nemania sp. NC0429]
MHKSAIEEWLQGAATYYAAPACPTATPLSRLEKRKGQSTISRNTTSTRGSHGGQPELHPNAAPDVEDLGPSNRGQNPRVFRSRARELPHRSGTRTKSRPPHDQDEFVDNDRDAENNAARDAFSKLGAASSTSPTDVIPDPLSFNTTCSTTSRSIASFPSTSAPSARTTESGKPKSPIKTLADLAVTSRFPILRSLDGGVPEDVRDLCEKLQTISWGENLIPAAVAGQFKRSHIPLRPWQIDGAAPPNIEELEYEIGMAQEISERANNLAEEGHSEPSWNCEVYSPILRLGLVGLDRVRHFNIATATPCPSLVPISEESDEILQSKLVDYSLNLVPARDSPLADAIDKFIATQSPEMRTVAPTMYDPVRRRPQAIAIETKLANSPSDPLFQLTVWTQATFARFRRLIDSTRGPDGISLLSLPLIAVRGHEWRLWFGHDTAHALELYGPLTIGSTETLMNTFKLIRSLRILAEWVDTDFRVWIERAFELARYVQDTEG